MVEDAVSWIGGGLYIEGLGKLLGDLIDSSIHTDDQEAVGSTSVSRATRCTAFDLITLFLYLSIHDSPYMMDISKL